MGYQFLAYGYSSQGYHRYLATELELSFTQLDAEEERLISRRVSIAEFGNMILSGAIKDATTVNTYGIAKLKGLIKTAE